MEYPRVSPNAEETPSRTEVSDYLACWWLPGIQEYHQQITWPGTECFQVGYLCRIEREAGPVLSPEVHQRSQIYFVEGFAIIPKVLNQFAFPKILAAFLKN